MLSDADAIIGILDARIEDVKVALYELPKNDPKLAYTLARYNILNDLRLELVREGLVEERDNAEDGTRDSDDMVLFEMDAQSVGVLPGALTTHTREGGIEVYSNEFVQSMFVHWKRLKENS